MTFPRQIYAGDSWPFPFTAPSVNPAAQLRLHINSAAFQFTTDPVTSLTGAYLFVVSSGVSMGFAPGTYILSVTQTIGSARTTLSAGHICNVEPDPSTASSFSYARRMVAALEALLEGRVTGAQAMYSAMSFEGRSITTLPIAELHRALVIYRAMVKDEDQAKAIAEGKGGRLNKINTRF